MASLTRVTEKKEATILFTDIQGSSQHWQEDPEGMSAALDKHIAQVTLLVEKYGGLVLKTIGDSFMILFENENLLDTLLSACKFSTELQLDLMMASKLIGTKNGPLHIRIGIAAGPVESKEMKIQQCNIRDFFGSTVNLASRMESKVSPVNGYAFCVASKNGKDEKFRELLSAQTLNELVPWTQKMVTNITAPLGMKGIIDLQPIYYGAESLCLLDKDFLTHITEEVRERSSRLLCQSLSLLKGVPPAKAFVISFKI